MKEFEYNTYKEIFDWIKFNLYEEYPEIKKSCLKEIAKSLTLEFCKANGLEKTFVAETEDEYDNFLTPVDDYLTTENVLRYIDSCIEEFYEN